MPADVHGVLSRFVAGALLVVSACSKDGGATASAGDAQPQLDAATAPSASPPPRTARALPSGLSSVGYDPLPLSPPRDAAAHPVASWQWKTYQGEGFSISFPGEPRITDLPPDSDRFGFTEAKVDVPGGQVSFAAGYSDHPPAVVAKPEAFLDERVNAPRRGTTEVVHKRSQSIGNHPGRVLILKRNISGTPLRVYSRLYLVGPRLYTLIVSTLETGGVSEDIVKRFMDSFALTAAPAPHDP